MQRTDTDMLEWMILYHPRLFCRLPTPGEAEEYMCRFRPTPESGKVRCYGPTAREAIAAGMTWMEEHEVIVTKAPDAAA